MEKLHAFGAGPEIGSKAPESILLIKFGKNKFTRNNKVSEFDVTEDDCDAMISEFDSRGKDLVVDFGHSSINPEAGFKGDAPAAAWCDSLEKTDKGISGHIKEWTIKGKERLESGEYKYLSPVLFFDKETQRPNSLHSAAMTNTPAIHGTEKLVAASDFWDEDEDKTVFIDKYKDLATKMVDNLRDLKGELKSTMTSLTDIAGEDEELKADITAFADGLYKEDIEAFVEMTSSEDGAVVAEKATTEEPESFQDVMAEYESRKNTMNGDALLVWFDESASRLHTELPGTTEAGKTAVQEQLNFITGKREELIAFKDANPELWAKGLIEKAVEVVEPAPVLAFSDTMIGMLKEKVSFADIDFEKGLTMEDIEKELKSLYAMKDSTVKALEDLGVTKIESVKEVIDKVNEQSMDVEARSFVQSCISDPECKITLAMSDWAIGSYKKDKEVFKKQYADAPVAFSQPPLIPNDNKSKPLITNTDRAIAEMLGNKPEEVYAN